MAAKTTKRKPARKSARPTTKRGHTPKASARSRARLAARVRQAEQVERERRVSERRHGRAAQAASPAAAVGGVTPVLYQRTKSKRVRFLVEGKWSRSYANKGAARRAAKRQYGAVKAIQNRPAA